MVKDTGYRPAVGDRCVFSPVGRIGRKVKPYAGQICTVVMVRYEPPPQWADAPPQTFVQFSDGFRYWLHPRQLYKA